MIIVCSDGGIENLREDIALSMIDDGEAREATAEEETDYKNWLYECDCLSS